jgi:hypothetical protein
MCLVGCSTLTYETKEGAKFTYHRLGSQEIQGLEVSKDENGVLTVKLEKNKADAGDLGKALADMAEVAKTMAK